MGLGQMVENAMQRSSNRRGWFYYQPLQVEHPRRMAFRMWFGAWKYDLKNKLFPGQYRRWLEREHGITSGK